MGREVTWLPEAIGQSPAAAMGRYAMQEYKGPRKPSTGCWACVAYQIGHQPLQSRQHYASSFTSPPCCHMGARHESGPWLQPIDGLSVGSHSHKAAPLPPSQPDLVQLAGQVGPVTPCCVLRRQRDMLGIPKVSDRTWAWFSYTYGCHAGLVRIPQPWVGVHA